MGQEVAPLPAVRDAVTASPSERAAERRSTTPPTARDLIQRFPMPAAVLGPRGAVELLNPKAILHVSRAWLESVAPELTALATHEQHRVMSVTDATGKSCPTTVYALALADQVIAVFGNIADVNAGEVLALHRRVFELERLSATDRLTGLWNRRHLENVVAREISFSEAQRSPLSMVVFDIDHFKIVNDTFGHSVGDEVLVAVADRLRAGCRPTDMLFRWGGEEFALLAPAASLGACLSLAQRMKAQVSAKAIGSVGIIRISAGIAEHQPGESAADWFSRADAALYESKRTGRDRVTASPGGASARWSESASSSALRLVWSESCVSGHPLIDREHRGLFEAANELLCAMTDERLEDAPMLERIDHLLNAVQIHFADEEAVLEAVRYPGLESHRALHRTLLQHGLALRDNVRSGAGTTGEIVEFLAYEIVNRHILKADRQFFPFLATPTANDQNRST